MKTKILVLSANNKNTNFKGRSRKKLSLMFTQNYRIFWNELFWEFIVMLKLYQILSTQHQVQMRFTVRVQSLKKFCEETIQKKTAWFFQSQIVLTPALECC